MPKQYVACELSTRPDCEQMAYSYFSQYTHDKYRCLSGNKKQLCRCKG